MGEPCPVPLRVRDALPAPVGSPVSLIVLTRSCSCRWGPCPSPTPRLVCPFYLLFISRGDRFSLHFVYLNLFLFVPYGRSHKVPCVPYLSFARCLGRAPQSLSRFFNNSILLYGIDLHGRCPFDLFIIFLLPRCRRAGPGGGPCPSPTPLNK